MIVVVLSFFSIPLSFPLSTSGDREFSKRVMLSFSFSLLFPESPNVRGAFGHVMDKRLGGCSLLFFFRFPP